MQIESSPKSECEREWRENGFFLVRGFAEAAETRAMLRRVIELARSQSTSHQGQRPHGPQENDSDKRRPPQALVMPEANISDSVSTNSLPEQRVSKVFRLHREQIFHTFLTTPAIAEILTPLLGSAVDCFLSQFIFKNPGAWGQPWHQDEFYFPFDHSPEVGLWLAVTEATLDNGCLYVLPGSHREPIHEHVQDRRPGANYGYFEIVDHPMSDAIPVLMQAGDLLVFHSRLMHRSHDNLSDQLRAAMVYHFAPHGTVDRSVDSPVNDWQQILPNDPQTNSRERS